MSAASALDGACYAATAGNLHTETTEDDAESQEEEDVIIDIDGNNFVYDFKDSFNTKRICWLKKIID